MSPRNGFLGAALLFGALSSGAVSHAKPADLPGSLQHQCPDGRDGQQMDGFTPRPDAVDAPPLRPSIDRRPDLDRARAPRNSDAAEEQDAPPARQNYREPSERRSGTNAEPVRRMRDSDRPYRDDTRRQEMLRSTQPLDTLPQRPVDEGGTGQEVELHAIQYYEVPPVQFSGPILESPRRMPKADEAVDCVLPALPALPAIPPNEVQAPKFTVGTSSELPLCDSAFGAVRIVRLPWGNWNIRSFCGAELFDWTQPAVVEQVQREIRHQMRCGSMSQLLEQVQTTIENSVEFAAIPNNLVPAAKVRISNPDETITSLINRQERVAVPIMLPDCIRFNRGLLQARGQVVLLMYCPTIDSIDAEAPADAAPTQFWDGPFLNRIPSCWLDSSNDPDSWTPGLDFTGGRFSR